MTTMKSDFSKLLHCLEDWLSHDAELRPERAEALRAELGVVEPEYRRCVVRCYRRIDFPKDPKENERFAKAIRENPTGIPLSLLNLLHTGKLEESVSSWTTDPQVAKDHNITMVSRTDTFASSFATIPSQKKCGSTSPNSSTLRSSFRPSLEAITRQFSIG